MYSYNQTKPIEKMKKTLKTSKSSTNISPTLRNHCVDRITDLVNTLKKVGITQKEIAEYLVIKYDNSGGKNYTTGGLEAAISRIIKIPKHKLSKGENVSVPKN